MAFHQAVLAPVAQQPIGAREMGIAGRLAISCAAFAVPWWPTSLLRDE
jgi:hypothetical protein